MRYNPTLRCGQVFRLIIGLKYMPKEEEGQPWWAPAMSLMGQLLGWIAVPIVFALFLGKYLDQKFHTYPWFFLGLVGFAFIISNVGMIRQVIRYSKELDKIEKNKQTKL